jgi:epoxyqueuosine reductase QueG
MHPRYQPRNTSLPLLDVLGWDAEDRAAQFRGSALKRMKLPMVKRNALIAAGNALRQADHPDLRRRIDQIAADEAEDPLVRGTARQIIEMFLPTG